jgi:hypothetical protein
MKKKIVPHCIYCEARMVEGQKVYLTKINQIVHAFCYQGEKGIYQRQRYIRIDPRKIPSIFC